MSLKYRPPGLRERTLEPGSGTTSASRQGSQSNRARRSRSTYQGSRPKSLTSDSESPAVESEHRSQSQPQAARPVQPLQHARSIPTSRSSRSLHSRSFPPPQPPLVRPFTAPSRPDPTEHNQREPQQEARSGNRDEAALARQARFSAPPAQPFGFASRGDLRLQNSVAEQRAFFDRTTGALLAGSDIDAVLADLRKLREAMLHAGPSRFLKKVFLFSVRVAAPAGRYQTVVPCLTYLLELRAALLLTGEEKLELVSLLALHISHVAGDTPRALALFFAHTGRDQAPRLWETLVSWARGDYYTWLQKYNSEPDPATFRAMTSGLGDIMRRMVHSLTCAYFQISRSEFETKFLPAGVTLATFMEEYAPHWELKEDTIVFRRRS